MMKKRKLFLRGAVRHTQKKEQEEKQMGQVMGPYPYLGVLIARVMHYTVAAAIALAHPQRPEPVGEPRNLPQKHAREIGRATIFTDTRTRVIIIISTVRGSAAFGSLLMVV